MDRQLSYMPWLAKLLAEWGLYSLPWEKSEWNYSWNWILIGKLPIRQYFIMEWYLWIRHQQLLFLFIPRSLWWRKCWRLFLWGPLWEGLLILILSWELCNEDSERFSANAWFLHQQVQRKVSYLSWLQIDIQRMDQCKLCTLRCPTNNW